MKNETVCEFSHRFVNTPQLDRLIRLIYRTPSGDETDLLYAYIIKLTPEIQKELVSRDFEKFKKLSQLIETAERYELFLQTETVQILLKIGLKVVFQLYLTRITNRKVKSVITAKNQVISNNPVYSAHQTVVLCRDFNH